MTSLTKTDLRPNEIPVIDVAMLAEGKTTLVGEQIRNASRDYGFFFIKNHGVGQGKIDRVFAASESFFALPDEEKLKLQIDSKNIGVGFMPMKASTLRTETLNNNTKPNLNESFFMLRDRSPNDPDVIAGKPFRSLNKWPASLPGFREALVDYLAAMEQLGKRLVTGFAAAFKMDMSYFEAPFKEPHVSVRLAHYPNQSVVGNNEFGSAPHTDFGFMTILAMTKVPGLEIRPKGMDWIRAPVLPGCFIVNTGDLLQRWTNNVFLSTPHRVINNTGLERYSIPFFFSPHPDHVVEPMEVFVTPDNPKQYEPISYAELYGRAVRKNYDHQDAKAEATANGA